MAFRSACRAGRSSGRRCRSPNARKTRAKPSSPSCRPPANAIFRRGCSPTSTRTRTTLAACYPPPKSFSSRGFKRHCGNQNIWGKKESGAAGLQADARLHAALPEPHRAHPAGGGVRENLHAFVGAIFARGFFANGDGVVSLELFRFILRRLEQCDLRRHRLVGAGALSVLGQTPRGCAG